jgi:hypothetical protein
MERPWIATYTNGDGLMASMKICGAKRVCPGKYMPEYGLAPMGWDPKTKPHGGSIIISRFLLGYGKISKSIH